MKDLLSLLCKYPYDSSNKDRLLLQLRNVKNWPKTVELINDHGIIALAAYNLNESGLQKEIPSEAMRFLDNGYLKNIARNTWLTARWIEVNKILNNAGIKHVLLKGMALEHTIYDSKGLRQMNDNDILVEQVNAIKAWSLLRNLGFHSVPFKSKYHQNIRLQIEKHLPRLTKNGYSVEIHFKLFENESSNTMSSYNPMDYTSEINIHGFNAFVLNKELQLSYLIDHFERHRKEGECQFRLFNDVKLLDKKSKLEFPESFILHPFQKNEVNEKDDFKKIVKSLTFRDRFFYVITDIFPTMEWMKDRYSCKAFKAIIYYPLRLGKLLWLI